MHMEILNESIGSFAVFQKKNGFTVTIDWRQPGV